MAALPQSARTKNCSPIRPLISAFINCSSWMLPNRGLCSSWSWTPVTNHSFWNLPSLRRQRNSKMPIYSMTGFARIQVRVPVHDQDQLSYTLTIKSVNHRFLDLQLRLPSGLDALEMDLRKALKDALIRGHVDLTLAVDRGTQQRVGYNRELVSNYLAAFREAQNEHDVKGE